MKYLVLLLIVVSCSRGSGVYHGVATDVGWEGYFIPSCEVMFKSSAEASKGERASSTDKALCDELMENMGKKYVVKWRHAPFNFSIDSEYIIETVKTDN